MTLHLTNCTGYKYVISQWHNIKQTHANIFADICHKSKLTNHAKQNTESLFCLLRIGTGESKESSSEKITSTLKTPAIKWKSVCSETRLSSLHLAGSEFQLESDHQISRFYMKTVYQISELPVSTFQVATTGQLPDIFHTILNGTKIFSS